MFVRKQEHSFFVAVCICCTFFIVFYWYWGIGIPATTVISIAAENPEILREKSDLSESQILGREVRIICLVTTGPKNINKVRAVKETWGRRCNKLIFVSSEVGNDTSLGIVALNNVSDGRNFLWVKTKQSFRYLYANYMNEADWFMKADDDTYVVLENLRHFLKGYNTNDPVYFGCKFNPDKTKLYASGGAGYVLSRESLRRFVEEALPNPKNCSAANGGSEDLEMGKCLKNVGVELIDSRDEFGRHRFMPLAPDRLVPRFPAYPIPPWYKKYMAYPQGQFFECCSRNAITFHYITPAKMYVLEYLIYYLHPIGVGTDPENSFVQNLDSTTTTTTTTTPEIYSDTTKHSQLTTTMMTSAVTIRNTTAIFA